MAYTTIKKPSSYFNTKLYAGNSSAGHAITGVGFQPDWTWIRERDAANHHIVVDAVRGATKYLLVTDTQAEVTSSNYVTSLDSDGFTLGSDAGTNRGSMVSWNWKANGAGVANTDGDIASTVSANTTSGFSIVSFTGNGGSDQQVGHGLGTTPTLYITKDRTNGSTNWHYHTTQIDGGMDFGTLNTTNAFASSSISTPSSTTIRVGGSINTSSANFISYVFAEKQGFSKFGSYTGNGSSDGVFCFTGMKPSFVMIKRTDSAGTDWNLVDNKRAGYNPDNYFLAPNSTGTENSVNDIVDLLSNGFKLTSASGASNASGGTYIYMAFAEEPLVGDNPATAR